ncbi:MAG: SIMPL domain-containing protein [Candidatus Brockarchaeota archaeon]|nr:SIMPL domain-containing protein [Candidatus Brockarchaeota archaeon]
MSFSVITEMKNASKMSSVIKSIRALEITENQIETFTYRLSPEFPKEGAPRVVGYVCSNTIKILINDLNAMGKLIDSAVATGANQVFSIDFTVSEEVMHQLELEVLSLAVKDAISKANTIATATGITLVGPV